MVKPVIFNRVLPLIDRVCSTHLNGLTPKDRVTVAKFKQTMTSINDRIMMQLFQPGKDQSSSAARAAKSSDDRGGEGGGHQDDDDQVPEQLAAEPGYLIDSDEED